MMKLLQNSERRLGEVLTRPGFSFPRFGKPKIYLAGPESASILISKGISVSNFGSNNSIVVDEEQTGLAVKISFGDRSGCCVLIGKGKGFNSSIVFRGDNGLVCISGIGVQGNSNLNITLDDSDNVLFLGEGTTVVGATFIVQGDQRRIILGDDCMLSWGITIRNYDSHTVYNMDTLERLNDPEDIEVGPHVWVGQNAMLLKSSIIGGGSIIGAHSIVRGLVPSFCSVAGSPARLIRTGIGWSRATMASRDKMLEVSTRLKRQYQLISNPADEPG